MSKLRPAAWAALAVGAAILVFAFSGAAGAVPAGYLAVALAGGLQVIAHPGNGQVSVLLPSGGAWVSASTASVTLGPISQRTLTTPAGGLPLNVEGIYAGDVINVVWLDGARTQQTSILTFT
jgi:hypothetical protein